MTNLIEKARLGRMNALSGLPTGPRDNPAGSRMPSQKRHIPVAFISARARARSATFLA